jgi:hypothetical protein
MSRVLDRPMTDMGLPFARMQDAQRRPIFAVVICLYHMVQLELCCYRQHLKTDRRTGMAGLREGTRDPSGNKEFRR